MKLKKILSASITSALFIAASATSIFAQGTPGTTTVGIIQLKTGGTPEQFARAVQNNLAVVGLVFGDSPERISAAQALSRQIEDPITGTNRVIARVICTTGPYTAEQAQIGTLEMPAARSGFAEYYFRLTRIGESRQRRGSEITPAVLQALNETYQKDPTAVYMLLQSQALTLGCIVNEE